MILLRLIYFMLFSAIFITLVTQIILPIINDLPIFPILKQKRRKVENDLINANLDIETVEKEQELKRKIKIIKERKKNGF
uniref:Uncharacterized protein n=1 Tax=viral metagenome TaxID=1070528 RepID=A0A6M3LDB1_9ZZZZ